MIQSRRLSRACLAAMSDVMRGHVDRGEVAGVVALDFWTLAYQAIED